MQNIFLPCRFGSGPGREKPMVRLYSFMQRAFCEIAIGQPLKTAAEFFENAFIQCPRSLYHSGKWSGTCMTSHIDQAAQRRESGQKGSPTGRIDRVNQGPRPRYPRHKFRDACDRSPIITDRYFRKTQAPNWSVFGGTRQRNPPAAASAASSPPRQCGNGNEPGSRCARYWPFFIQADPTSSGNPSYLPRDLLPPREPKRFLFWGTNRQVHEIAETPQYPRLLCSSAGKS